MWNTCQVFCWNKGIHALRTLRLQKPHCPMVLIHILYSATHNTDETAKCLCSKPEGVRSLSYLFPCPNMIERKPAAHTGIFYSFEFQVVVVYFKNINPFCFFALRYRTCKPQCIAADWISSFFGGHVNCWVVTDINEIKRTINVNIFILFFTFLKFYFSLISLLH